MINVMTTNRIVRIYRLLAVLLAALLLAGCVSAGPDYKPPEIKMPGQWKDRTGGQTLTEADHKALADWWTRLDDPVLTDLVQRAVAGNLNLKAAETRVKEVRLRRLTARANLLPGLSASGRRSITRSMDENEELVDREAYSLGLDVSWEIDIFGGTRRDMEAAEADYQAAREDLRDVLVSLTAETATAYVQLRTYQKRLELTRQSLRIQEESVELTRIKYQTGLAGALDVEQAVYSLESTRSQVPDLEAGISEMKNRLAVLLGAWPGELDKELASKAPIPAGTLQKALGVPADLLRRRPDIRAAERQLAAQTARVGSAEAELYPKLNFSGSLAWDALTLSGLITPANFVSMLATGITWNLFNKGTVRANIKIQTALQEEALIAYENTLHTAVEEVENAFTSLATETNKQEALTKALAAATSAAELANHQYTAGLSDFQNVLETQRSMISFQNQLAASQGQSTLNLIVMYKALGGGWTQ